MGMSSQLLKKTERLYTSLYPYLFSFCIMNVEWPYDVIFVCSQTKGEKTGGKLYDDSFLISTRTMNLWYNLNVFVCAERNFHTITCVILYWSVFFITRSCQRCQKYFSINKSFCDTCRLNKNGSSSIRFVAFFAVVVFFSFLKEQGSCLLIYTPLKNRSKSSVELLCT